MQSLDQTALWICKATVSQLGAENPHFYFKMAMTVLVLEVQGGKKIRMSLLSSLISVQNLSEVS